MNEAQPWARMYAGFCVECIWCDDDDSRLFMKSFHSKSIQPLDISLKKKNYANGQCDNDSFFFKKTYAIRVFFGSLD